MNKMLSVIGLMSLLSAAPAFADHNSPMGEGWALDPLDKHSDAIDSLDNMGMDMDTMREVDVEPPIQRSFDDITEVVQSDILENISSAGDARDGDLPDAVADVLAEETMQLLQ